MFSGSFLLGCLAAQRQKSPLSQHPDAAPCCPSSLTVFLHLLVLLRLYLVSQLALSAHGILCLMKTSCTQLFLVSKLVSSQTCRHNMVWGDQFLLWGPVLSPRQWFMQWVPWGTFLFAHGAIPLAKANECGTSPDRATKTGRKDAQPGGLLVHLGICSEAWRGTSLPKSVEYPNPSARTSHADSLPFPRVFKVHWGISWLKSKACISPSSASCCYHQTLSTVPIVGSVNYPWTAIKKHQQFVSRFSGKGTRQEILCFGLAQGGLLPSSETLALLCRFPVAFGGLWGVVWTPVVHSSFLHAV